MPNNSTKTARPIVEQLESKMTEWFDDNIEIDFATREYACKWEWVARIFYDGTNNKNNCGMVYFTFRTKHDAHGDEVIEEFNIMNVTGSNYRPFSEKLKEALK